MRGLFRVMWVLAVCGCQGGTIMVPPTTVELPKPERLTGAVVAGEALHRTELSIGHDAVTLGRVGGQPVLAGADGVFSLGGADVVAVPVGAPGETMTTGAVRFIAPRGDGLLAIADSGLFHDDHGHLLRSPLSDSYSMRSLTAVETFGSGESEELWLRESSGLSHVSGTTRELVEVTADGALVSFDVAVASGAQQAVLVAGDRLYRVDLQKQTAKVLAADVPTVSAWAHADDGTVYLATTQGLLTVRTDDAVTLHSLAAEGQPAQAVADVALLDSELFVVSQGKLITRGPSGFSSIADVGSPVARGLSRDSTGTLYVLDGASQVAKLSTTRPVSFETDVKPFMVTHCQNCHTTGADYSPVRRFDQLDVAREFADTIVLRLRADGTSPMPPAYKEVLTPDQYAVVLRWVQGGKQP